MTRTVAMLCLALITASPSRGIAADADTDQALTQKLNSYVDCLNAHGNWVTKSRDRYLSWIADEKVGPTADESEVLGVYRLRDPGECLAGIAAAAELPPDLPELEADATHWAEALTAARAVVDEANDYYEPAQWRDDAMAQGKALHPRLIAAYDTFDAANQRLHEQVSAAKNLVAAGELERLRADPAQQEQYHLRLTLFRGRELVELAFTSEGFAAAAFTAKLAEFEAARSEAVADLERHVSAGDDSIDIRLFLDAAGDYLKAAQAFGLGAKEGERYDLGGPADADATAEGDPDQLLDRYNGFVEAGNRFLD